jgi:hypothetical protein
MLKDIECVRTYSVQAHQTEQNSSLEEIVHINCLCFLNSN